jgi:hypothetical protein
VGFCVPNKQTHTQIVTKSFEPFFSRLHSQTTTKIIFSYKLIPISRKLLYCFESKFVLHFDICRRVEPHRDKDGDRDTKWCRAEHISGTTLRLKCHRHAGNFPIKIPFTANGTQRFRKFEIITLINCYTHDVDMFFHS